MVTNKTNNFNYQLSLLILGVIIADILIPKEECTFGAAYAAVP